jgi:hypothetical protein
MLAEQADLDPWLQQQILDSLLSLSVDNPEHCMIMEATGAH